MLELTKKHTNDEEANAMTVEAGAVIVWNKNQIQALAEFMKKA